MPKPRLSAAWLSDDMAQALAAMCPPLETTDVEQAADELTRRAGQTLVVDGLLRRDLDLLEARRLVEVLRALRDSSHLAPPPPGRASPWP